MRGSQTLVKGGWVEKNSPKTFDKSEEAGRGKHEKEREGKTSRRFGEKRIRAVAEKSKTLTPGSTAF